MTSYPVEIRRCRHIKTNGTQCGSPALKGGERCYYHEQNQPVAAELYLDGDRYSDGLLMIPVFEDAHSIQTMIRHVLQLMLQHRIDRKDAGLMLYGLQIVSGNLKMMQAEKAKPTQVVVEVEKAGETPLGMTPWSASGKGHDPEEEEEAGEPEPALSRPREIYEAMNYEERHALRESLQEQGIIAGVQVEEYLMSDGPDPLVMAMERLYGRKRAGRENSGRQGGEDVAPGDIQACARDSSRRRR